MFQLIDPIHAAQTFRALSSQVRIQIILLLEERDYCVHELVRVLDRSQPLISQHLCILKQAGLVEATRHGRLISYRLSNKNVARIVELASEPMTTPTDAANADNPLNSPEGCL